MNITWFCNFADCKHPKERTSSHVLNISHTHNKVDYELIPYKKPMKPRGVETPKSLKKKVWDLFSEYVRRSEADDNGYCTCITCGAFRRWEDMDAGHFIHGTSFLIPELVHAQCKPCNGFGAGMLIDYEKYMIKTYGQNKVDELTFKAKRLSKKLSIWELQQYQNMYLKKLGD